MANGYFTYNGELIAATVGRADVIGDLFEAIEKGFDLLPAAAPGGGFSGAMAVGAATLATHALQLTQFLTWAQDVSANGKKLTNLANPSAAGDATSKTYVDSEISARILAGGSPGAIGITQFGVGTATANQFVRVNAAGNAIVGYTLDLSTLPVGSIPAGRVLRVNAAGTAVEGVDTDLEDAAAAVYAYANL